MIKKLFALIRFALRPLAAIVNRLAAHFGGESARRRRRAQRLAGQLISELSRLGFTRRMIVPGKRRRGRSKRERVTFEQPLLMTADELWCPIDLAKLPTGVKTDDLRDESVLRSLMDRTDCSVRIDYLGNGKICYVIRHGGAQFPEKITINQLERGPELAPLAIPAGVNADGDQIWIDLDDVIHLLIAGATGGGKTVFGHAAITTLISRNTADDIELWLVDMKQAEFSLYRPLWDKKGNGIVKKLAIEPEDAIDLLDQAVKEIDRRNALMAQHNATSLDDLAQSVGIRLRRVVIWADEFAQLTLNTEKIGKVTIGKIAENRLTRIASLGRSAGFRIVIATQMVNSKVVSSLIRANFENRISFSTADWRQSQMIVESSDADGIPKGRAVMRLKGILTMVQTALITPRQVRIEVERVSQFGPDGVWGEDEEKARFVKDAKLLVSVACQHFGGDLARNKVLALEGVRGVITFDRFNEVCQRLEKDGVLEPGRSNRPRKVAKGFFNRLGLIDQMYGTEPTADPTTEYPSRLLLAAPPAVEERQEAKEADTPVTEPAVCGVENSSPPTTETDSDDPPPPSWWGQIDPTVAPPPPPAPAARPRARVTQARKARKR